MVMIIITLQLILLYSALFVLANSNYSCWNCIYKDSMALLLSGIIWRDNKLENFWHLIVLLLSLNKGKRQRDVNRLRKTEDALKMWKMLREKKRQRPRQYEERVEQRRREKWGTEREEEERRACRTQEKAVAQRT